MGCGEGFREASGFSPRDLLRDAQELGSLYADVAGLATTGNDGHDAITDMKIGDLAAYGQNAAGNLETRNVGHDSSRGGVKATPLQLIGTIEP
jgi:hypothetical protein